MDQTEQMQHGGIDLTRAARLLASKGGSSKSARKRASSRKNLQNWHASRKALAEKLPTES